jgi:crotonobetainyl-CoA:carnitine CoA-transferase CaiB-like acyl-CoA transferase
MGGVLQGVRVLDLSTRVAGPYCACVLAEFGADVVKIELPGEGDPYRQVGTPATPDATLSYLNDNRNKRCLTLDVRKPEGARLFRQLAAKADVVVENFRPGTLEKWGLGADLLQQDNPGLIVVRISAYGQNGRHAHKPGVARVAYGYSGVSYLCGEPSGPPLYPATISFGDYVAGQCAATGALLAYIERLRSGRGQVVDVSLYESLLRMMDELVPAYAWDGQVRERAGAGSPVTVPSNHYRTADGHWVVISTSSSEMFRRLVQAMGQPELAQRFAARDARMAHRDAIEAAVADWVGGQTREQVLAAAEAADIPAGPINSIADLFADPHLRERGSLREVRGPGGRSVTVVDTVPRLSRTPGRSDTLGPALGQHTDELLAELGLDPARIEQLRREGIA